VARTKTTVYLDPSVLRATRVAAARRGRRDSDIVEEALRRFLGLEAIAMVRGRSSLGEEDAMRLANEEVHAYRRELRARPR
jgi:hypothetical protein